MQIIEGSLPETRNIWHVLIPRSPRLSLGKSWQLALLLAKAGAGNVILAITIEEYTDQSMEAARELFNLAKQDEGPKVKVFPLIVYRSEYEKEVNAFIREKDIDILVDDVADPVKHDLDHCPCAVAAVRGDIEENNHNLKIQRIAVPTSGGPNTMYALNTLKSVASDVEIVALYIAPEHLGENEEALGRSRLNQALEYIDGRDQIQTQLISSPSIVAGIREAAKDYDLVVIGASRESSIDKMLFGNIPDTVVRESKSTIVVMREPNSRVAHALGEVSWRLQRILPRLNVQERSATYVRIRRSARPTVDYYILIALAAIIAAFGLIVNSAAVVIGAMLVAPLMSPIVGTGLAMVLGDTRFLRLTLGAVLRGSLLAIFVGIIVGIFQIGNPLTGELLARTQPSLLDLAIAWFSGMAAAFALSRSNAAGALPGVAIAAALVPPLATVGVTFTAGFFVQSLGALLLFVTNFVAIGTATALVFIILGFRPAASQKSRQQVRTRSAQIAVISLLIISGLLVGTSYFLSRQEAGQARIHEVVVEKLHDVAGAELQELKILDFKDGKLTLEIIARSHSTLGIQNYHDLQEAIGGQLVADGIIDEITMTLSVIKLTELDPLVPPTPTPGPSPTPEPETAEVGK